MAHEVWEVKMSFLQKAWKKLKRIPIIGWVAMLVILVVVGLYLFFRKGPGWLHNRSQTAAPAPRVTPEQGEEIKEEIRKEEAAELKKIEAEQDEVADQIDDWMKRLE